MYVIIVGGGKVGAHLASLLLDEGHTVRVIESRPDMLEKLHRILPLECIHEGDGTDPVRLEQLGARRANVLAAVTGEDETNLVATSLARYEFNVPRIIARVNNPLNTWLFNSELGVDVALSQADVMAKMIIEEMSLGDMITLLKLRKGEVELVEEKIAEDSPVVGKAVRDVNWPPQCTLAAVIRKGDVIAPNGSTVLEFCDEVLAVVHTSQRRALANLLGHSNGA